MEFVLREFLGVSRCTLEDAQHVEYRAEVRGLWFVRVIFERREHAARVTHDEDRPPIIESVGELGDLGPNELRLFGPVSGVFGQSEIRHQQVVQLTVRDRLGLVTPVKYSMGVDLSTPAATSPFRGVEDEVEIVLWLRYRVILSPIVPHEVRHVHLRLEFRLVPQQMGYVLRPTSITPRN